MADGSPRQARRFSAFISYSNEDAAFARRLHRRLETYRLPRRLTPTRPDAPATGRLRPLFRDEDELSASHDLSAALRDALAQSEFLIVVCSPSAARSDWVGREIEYFRSLHGDRRILTALAAGAPEDAFHPALRRNTGGAGIEPLAADFRRESGLRHLAMLKLVAALAEVELDQLIQRDAQRTTRRAALSAAAAGVVLAVMAGLTWVALDSRAEAARKGEQATGLVDYILTDVRTNQERVGKLSDLAKSNSQVLRYFASQPKSKLTVAERIQQARLLQAMGEDDEKRGDLHSARARQTAAFAITSRLFTDSPTRTDIIFAHAQSEYWVGYVDWREGASEAAYRHFQRYAALARQLVALEPSVADWRHEVAYSKLNLGTYLLRHSGDGEAAAAQFAAALAILSRLAEASPGDEGLRREVADAHAWLADSQRVRGQLDAAFESRARERRILDAILANDRENVAAQRDILGNELATARLLLAEGDTASALRRLRAAKSKAARLVRLDPESAATANQLRIIELYEIKAELQPGAKHGSLPSMLQRLGECRPSRPTSAALEIADFCRALRREATRGTDGSPGDSANVPTSSTSDKYSRRWGIEF